ILEAAFYLSRGDAASASMKQSRGAPGAGRLAESEEGYYSEKTIFSWLVPTNRYSALGGGQEIRDWHPLSEQTQHFDCPALHGGWHDQTARVQLGFSYRARRSDDGLRRSGDEGPR